MSVDKFGVINSQSKWLGNISISISKKSSGLISLQNIYHKNFMGVESIKALPQEVERLLQNIITKGKKLKQNKTSRIGHMMTIMYQMRKLEHLENSAS